MLTFGKINNGMNKAMRKHFTVCHEKLPWQYKMDEWKGKWWLKYAYILTQIYTKYTRKKGLKTDCVKDTIYDWEARKRQE